MKYYIPTIEEFHVGFEYEYKNHTGTVRNLSDMDWNKTIVQSINELAYVERGLQVLDNTRVKYLDQEDIESLGFIDISAENSPFDIKSFTCKSEVLTLSKDGFVQIYHANLQKTLRGFLFMGTIKNISELKVLLKQLNIN